MKRVLSILAMTAVCAMGVELNNFNELQFEGMRCNQTGNVIGDGQRTTYKASARTHNDVVFNEHFKMATTLEFIYASESINLSVDEPEEARAMVNLNQFLFVYSFDSSVFVSAGQINMKRGAFSEYAHMGRENSDGLFTMYDTTLQGAMLGYRYGDSNRIFFGYGVKHVVKVAQDFGSFADIAGPSWAYFAMSSNEWKIDDKGQKVILKLNGSYSSVKPESNEDLEVARLKLAGFGLSWDDSEDSGYVAYTILAASDMHNLLDGTSNHGYNALFGARKDFDYVGSNMSGNMGGEIYHSSRHWKSMVPGEPTSLYGYGKLGNVYSMYIGIDPVSQMNIKLRYIYSDLDYKRTGVTTTKPADIKQHDVILDLMYAF